MLGESVYVRESVIQTTPLGPRDGAVRIFVNFDIHSYNPGCGLAFELVDAGGVPIPGYTSDECITCTEVGLYQPVSWQNHDLPPSTLPAAAELRGYFRTNGDSNPYQPEASSPLLYAVYLEEAGCA